MIEERTPPGRLVLTDHARGAELPPDLPGKAVQKLPTNCQHETHQNAVFIYYNCKMPKCEQTIVNIDLIRVFVAYLYLTLYGLRPREGAMGTRFQWSVHVQGLLCSDLKSLRKSDIILAVSIPFLSKTSMIFHACHLPSDIGSSPNLAASRAEAMI